MAETPSPPPGWPFDELPPQDPTPTPVPPYEPEPYEPPVFDGTFTPPPLPAIPAAPQSTPGQPPPPGSASYAPPSTGQPPPPGPRYAPPPSTAQPPPPGSGFQQPPPPGSASYAPPSAAQTPPPGARFQQPPPPAPTYYGAPPPPAKRRGRGLLYFILGLLAVCGLLIGACSVWFINTVTAPVDESNRFLATVDRGDYAAAVAMTNPRCNQSLTVEVLQSLFEGQDIAYDLNSSEIVNSSATVSGSFTGGLDQVESIQLTLMKSGDNWTVCTFSLS